MKPEIKKEIERFIIDNELFFESGSRNNDSVVLSGYSLYLGIEDSEVLDDLLCEMKDNDEKKELLVEFDYDASMELERVFNFAYSCNYGDWWTKESNRNTYKMDPDFKKDEL